MVTVGSPQSVFYDIIIELYSTAKYRFEVLYVYFMIFFLNNECHSMNNIEHLSITRGSKCRYREIVEILTFHIK